jgi:hypothetical protein
MLLFKRIIIGFLASIAFAGVAFAEPASAAPASDLPTDAASVLARSQVSYRAEGGFSGVESYGVIISCVGGDISVLASIHDPRLPSEPMRKIGKITPERYIELWNGLIRQASARMGDGPVLDRDVLDEFTVTFNLSVGEKTHRFRAQGLSLPECSRYQAVRALIDDTVQMAELWKAHDQAAGLEKDDTQRVTFETLTADLELQP